MSEPKRNIKFDTSLIIIQMSSGEQIERIANTILTEFIPKDPDQKELIFHFTLPPNTNYKVWYKKTDKSIWKFVRFEEVEK